MRNLFLILFTFCFVSCAGYTTTVGVAYEHEGRRMEGNVTLTPVSGKNVVRTTPRKVSYEK